MTIVKPRIPVISNVDAKAHSDPEVIKQILAKQVHAPCTRHARAMHAPTRPRANPTSCQVTAPVQWESIMQGLIDGGFEKGYELGPGKVLAGIMKRVDKTKLIENIEV